MILIDHVGWNNHVGRKKLPILGNFGSLKWCRVELKVFSTSIMLKMVNLRPDLSNSNETNILYHQFRMEKVLLLKLKKKRIRFAARLFDTNADVNFHT